MLRIMLVATLLLTFSCKLQKNEKDSSNKQNYKLRGKVSTIISNIIIGQSYASENIKCKSSCQNPIKTKCIQLFEVNQDGSESKICETDLDQNDEYEFDIDNKKALSGKTFKYIVDDFHGEKREKIEDIIDDDLDRDSKDSIVDPISTISVPIIIDKIKKNIPRDSFVSEEDLLKDDIFNMCPNLTNSELNLNLSKNIFNLRSKENLDFFKYFRKYNQNNGNLLLIKNKISKICKILNPSIIIKKPYIFIPHPNVNKLGRCQVKIDGVLQYNGQVDITKSMCMNTTCNNVYSQMFNTNSKVGICLFNGFEISKKLAPPKIKLPIHSLELGLCKVSVDSNLRHWYDVKISRQDCFVNHCKLYFSSSNVFGKRDKLGKCFFNNNLIFQVKNLNYVPLVTKNKCQVKYDNFLRYNGTQFYNKQTCINFICKPILKQMIGSKYKTGICYYDGVEQNRIENIINNQM